MVDVGVGVDYFSLQWMDARVCAGARVAEMYCAARGIRTPSVSLFFRVYAGGTLVSLFCILFCRS